MNYSDNLKVCWYTPIRNGTRSTSNLLRTLNFDIFGTHSFFLPKERQGYTLISNIRNPYSRLVSIFYLKGLHHNNFENNFKIFCESSTKPNTSFYSEYQIDYDKKIRDLKKPFHKFVRLESFVEDLKSLDFINLSNPKVKECFETHIEFNRFENEFENIMDKKRKKWYEFYDEELANFIYEKLKDQFLFFGYEKNSWKHGTS